MAELHYLQVTRECNQACRFCSNPASNRTISAAAARRHIDRLITRKAEGVILTGGEPTLHPDLNKIIAYASRRKLPVRITTNGQKVASPAYLNRLRRAGLAHIHFSVHSHRPSVHDYLTRKRGSLDRLFRALANAGRLGLRADVNVVINRLNSGHLHLLAAEICRRFPFVGHFVFNNMDPGMERAIEDISTVPVLSEFEAPLARAMRLLQAAGRTFRVERVPLCFMSEFQHCATETRKLVKEEGRSTYFLDEKKLVVQTTWEHGKPPRCSACGLNRICAGLFKMDVYYKSEELCPVFADPDAIVRDIKAT
jgi:MoaA/NifB/PqqE/SkfB family radical SAM enzyme